ncbi:hypothetical protein ABN034_32695 [Actinopolymorpha sp. B11F2]|uniref:arsenate reductase/protein-tyrosine-phosphatase family protein n=1 Tax=Actinopolymorpha sp. B11F2 TaxID=3160862 RepID=UPI0032E4BC7F
MTTFSIMFVCTGNMCRSPIAERLAVSALERHLGDAAGTFRVFGAGTGTYAGREMTPEAAAVVSAYGGDPDGFRSTELTADLVGAADLILTATRAHRSAVVTLDPGALRRTFTLTEFARTTAALADRAPEPDPAVLSAATEVAAASGAVGATSLAATDPAGTADRLAAASEAEGDGAVDASPTDPVERARAVVALVARQRGTIRPGSPDEDDIPDPIGRPMAVYEAAGATISQAVATSIAALVGARA